MKKLLIGIFVILLVVSFGGCTSNKSEEINVGNAVESGEAVKENVDEIKWLSYSLVIKEIREVNESDNLLNKSAFEGYRYVIAELYGKDMMIKSDDISAESVRNFVLIDMNGNKTEPEMFTIWGISYDDSTGFSTDEMQEGFRLMFLIDENSTLESLQLKIK